MGVPHLWEVRYLADLSVRYSHSLKVLRRAGKSRSIVDISVTEGFEVNRTK